MRADQDRRTVAVRPRGEVQPAAADRGGARAGRDVSGPQRVPQLGGVGRGPAKGGPMARSAAAAARPRPRARSTIQWQKVGRLALLFTLFVIVLLYIRPVAHWIQQR